MIKSGCSWGYRQQLKLTRLLHWDTNYLMLKEVWNFKKHSNTLFSDFINALYKGKLEVSSYPNNVVTTKETLKYLAEIHEHKGIQLDMDKIVKNLDQHQMCKILLNSFW